MWENYGNFKGGVGGKAPTFTYLYFSMPHFLHFIHLLHLNLLHFYTFINTIIIRFIFFIYLFIMGKPQIRINAFLYFLNTIIIRYFFYYFFKLIYEGTFFPWNFLPNIIFHSASFGRTLKYCFFLFYLIKIKKSSYIWTVQKHPSDQASILCHALLFPATPH